MGIFDSTPGGQFNPQPGQIVLLLCPDGGIHHYTVPDTGPLFSDFTCPHVYPAYQHSFA